MAADLRGQSVIEYLEATAAAVLRLVEGRVGVTDQGFRLILPVADRYADAGADEVLAAAEDERLGERAGQALRQPGRVHLAGDVLEQHRKLIPTEPRHRVPRPQSTLKPRRDGGQQHVAGGVAEAVVDQLELVEVEEQ